MRGEDLKGGYYFIDSYEGRLKVVMPDGEILEGGFIRVLDVTSAESRGYSGESQTLIHRGYTGTALLHGNRGTTMQCQYTGSTLTGRAFGNCKTNTGKQYSLQLLGESAS